MAGFKGKINLSALRKFQESLKSLDEESRQKWNEATVRELAARLLSKVIRRTPVGKPPRPDKSERYITIKTKGAARTKTTESGYNVINGRGYSSKNRKFLTEAEARYQQYWSGYNGGTLRKGWTGGESRNPAEYVNSIKVTKTGETYLIEIINPVEYAPYVEFGHSQEPGRFVTAIGKRLKKAWVNGKFMLTISEEELQRDAPGIIMNKLNAFLGSALK